MKENPSILPHALAEFLSRVGGDDYEVIEPILRELQEKLAAGSSCVQVDQLKDLAEALGELNVVGPPEAGKPLVLSAEGNLYFRRYFEYEQSLASSLLRLANNKTRDVSSPTLSRLNDYFGKRDDQMAAAQLALTKGVSIITGGPGTGKTYLAVGVIAALLAENPDLGIARCKDHRQRGPAYPSRR